MATVARDFTHFDRSFAKGDEVPDDDPLVTGAPHLFVQPDPEPGAESAWDAEITQRIARFDSGEAQPVPAAEVFERLREIAPGP